jgi:hypothetical protein
MKVMETSTESFGQAVKEIDGIVEVIECGDCVSVAESMTTYKLKAIRILSLDACNRCVLTSIFFFCRDIYGSHREIKLDLVPYISYFHIHKANCLDLDCEFSSDMNSIFRVSDDAFLKMFWLTCSTTATTDVQ